MLPRCQATAEPANETYTSPFAYCAAVGTIDVPGTAYTGDAVPPAVFEGLSQALNGDQKKSGANYLRNATLGYLELHASHEDNVFWEVSDAQKTCPRNFLVSKHAFCQGALDGAD